MELVYNLQDLHPSLSLMDVGVCSESEGGVEIGSRRPPSSMTIDKESPLQFGVPLVFTAHYQRHRDESRIQGRGLQVGRISRGQQIFERGDGGVGRMMWSVHTSLPSSIAPGLVMLKAGRLKGLMGARVMLCGVI